LSHGTSAKETTAAKWHMMQRRGLGLTQVCHQLRVEFLPIFRDTHPPVKLGLDKVEQYFRDWIALDYKLAKADICITTNHAPRGPFDMHTLILLSSAAPNIAINIRDDVDEEDAGLKPDIYSPWYDYLRRCVRSVYYVNEGEDCGCCRYVDEVVVWVRVECAEKWMQAYREEVWEQQREYREGVEEWMERLDIENPSNLTYTVRVAQP
jgi:hypothetical protein